MPEYAVPHVSTCSLSQAERTSLNSLLLLPALPGVPQGVTAAASSSTSLTVSWSPPRSIVAPFNYSVNCSQADYNQLVDSTTQSVTVGGLHPFTDYQCCVSAINSAGSGPEACVNKRTLSARKEFVYNVMATTANEQLLSLPIAPTAAPTNVKGSAISSTSISLSWNSLPLDQRNGLIQEYRINAVEVTTGKLKQHTSTSLQKVVSALHPYYTYRFTVAAFTVGIGPYSSPITVQTFSDGAFILTAPVTCVPGNSGCFSFQFPVAPRRTSLPRRLGLPVYSLAGALFFLRPTMASSLVSSSH